MKGNCRNLIEHIETGMCSRCQGSGEIDDAEPGDISFNTADCGTCNGTGWQDKHDRYLTFETDKRKTMLMDALDAAKYRKLLNIIDDGGAQFLLVPMNESEVPDKVVIDSSFDVEVFKAKRGEDNE